MINPEVGDYVVSTDKIFEIVYVGKIGLDTVYTVRAIDNPADILEELDINVLCDEIKNTMSLSRLRHLGEIVKKEEASKAIEVLFKR